jgi:tetratricopeptide (TPR) repeat protein
MERDRTRRAPVGTLPAFLLRPHSGRLCVIALVLLTVVSYVPALEAGFVFDDSMYLTGDARMGSAEGLGDIWAEVAGPDYRHQYYPLTSSAFWVQHRLFGDHATGYHLVNILLHAVNAVLLWRLLRRLGVPAAWVAGAVFAVHPVHVQSVAWISELKNVLSTVFFLSSGLLLVGYLGLGAEGQDRRWQGWPVYAVGLVLFVCALLSKTATSLLPVALLLAVWWKRGRVDRRSVLAVAPLVVVGAGFVLMTVYLESSHGGAQGVAFSQTWLERVLIAGRSLWFYAGKLLWPADLVFIYPRWTIDASAWWQYVYPLSALAVLGLLWGFQDRVGRGPAAAVLFFAVAVVPVALVNVAFTRLSYVADHWQYWASMGLIALVVGSLALGWTRWRPSWAPQGSGVLASVLVLLVLSGLTWRRARVYESPMTLWSDTLAQNPDAWVAHNNLGIALAAEGRFDEAISHHLQSLVQRPEAADAHNNLGDALQAQGRLEEAIIHYRWALQTDADYAPAHYNLANALRQAGDVEVALRHYRLALRIDPRYAKAHNNYGTALLERGRLDQAIAHFQRAISIDPDHAGARYNLGIARYRQGRVAEAARQFEAALAIDPAFTGARANLAAIVQAHARGADGP